MNATARENNVKSNLQIFVLGHDHAASHPSGIRCSIDSRGRMIVASDHVSKAEVSRRAVSQHSYIEFFLAYHENHCGGHFTGKHKTAKKFSLRCHQMKTLLSQHACQSKLTLYR